ncbi:MAG: DUF3445 domain-containing protein [Candidatus Latescibacteria bacterium]|nr:DUF3445 domain-containing protein [Candidatus Latescibacterota bacterium]
MNRYPETPPAETLADAAQYFPPADGVYQVKPGLMRLGHDLGKGPADTQVFQFDQSFPHFRQAKLQARAERLAKYYQTADYAPEVANALACFLVQRLAQEHPAFFQLEETSTGSRLHCALTSETLRFNSEYRLVGVQAAGLSPTPPYTDALDALASQVHEDLAIVCRRPDDSDWLAAAHLCCPNHWAAEEKIGRDFAQVHAPVAGMAPLNQRRADLVRAMIERGPYVRFSWGLGTDTRLNHHPEPPPGIPAANWYGRHFDPAQPRLFVRVERQVLWSFPAQQAALFTIRTSFRDCARLTPEERTQLRLAILSMTPETLVYKGLAAHRDAILEWLAKI